MKLQIGIITLWLTSPLCVAEAHLRSSARQETQDKHDVEENRRLASPDLRYRLYSIDEIEAQVTALSKSYPNLIKVTTSQKEYGLQAAGGYVNYILTIQDFVAHPEGSDSSNRLPEVFFSGALHGDERVGPTVTVETAKLLLRAATCEANPTASCQNRLSALGVEVSDRQWMSRLVTTRRVVIVPNANALGYAQNVREENGIDPNRDFAYDQKPSKCMQSIAARTLNEIWREHQFQLAITFHGGMEIISYEWGATSYEGTSSVSPDDVAQRQISKAYSEFGGAFSGSPKYQYGISNSVVYGVYGGMEDWGYAASWDTKLSTTCNPSTYGGYPASKTTYTSGMFRAFNILIEVSNDKNPARNTLGSRKNLMNPNANSNGYVARCIRQSLLSIDMVEPYVVVESVSGNSLAKDLTPLKKRNGRSCQSTKVEEVSRSGAPAKIQFKVGGAITVDSTEVWYGKWNDVPNASLNCIEQPTYSDITQYLTKGTIVGGTSGNGIFSPSGSATLFTATIDQSQFAVGDSLVVLVATSVDSQWAKKPDNVTPNVGPQSHIVNARTNPKWKSTNNEKVIEGRLKWFSDPLTLAVT